MSARWLTGLTAAPFDTSLQSQEATSVRSEIGSGPSQLFLRALWSTSPGGKSQANAESGHVTAHELMLQLPEDPFDFSQGGLSSQQPKQPVLSGQQQSLNTTLFASGHSLLWNSCSLYSTPYISTLENNTDSWMTSAQDCLNIGCSAANTNSEVQTSACLSLTTLERQLQRQATNHGIWAYDHNGSNSEVAGWGRALSPSAVPAAPATPSPTTSASSALSALAVPFRPRPALSLLRMGSGQGSEASSSGPPMAPQTPPQRGTSDTELLPGQDSWGFRSDEDLCPSTPDQAAEAYVYSAEHTGISPFAWVMSKANSYRYHGRQWLGNILRFHQEFAMSMGEGGLGSRGAAVLASGRASGQVVGSKTCLVCNQGIPEIFSLPCCHLVTCLECQKNRGSNLPCPDCKCCVSDFDFIPAVPAEA